MTESVSDIVKTRFEGGCLCGAVRYRHDGPLSDISACHCEQCRRTSGHYVAAARGMRARLSFERDEGLRWYESSPGVVRGFCGECGSSLFWDRVGADNISIMAGTLDAPTGLRLVKHIYVADAGDYYDIDPDLPRAEQEAGEPPPVPAAATEEE